MNSNMKISQQEQDNRTQTELTSKVGVRLTRPEKSTTSRWSTAKRLLRIG